MKILLAILALIILVAIAIVGWLVLKKKQSGLESTSTLPPFARESLDSLSQTQPASTTISVDDLLAQVDASINMQNYDVATNELKRLLITNPHNPAIMLKLLQVYALTGNQPAFDQLYQTLLSTGDQNSIRDAHTLQILLNDSLNTATSQPTEQLVTSDDASKSSATLDDGLSFDDLADFGIEETKEKTQESSESTDEFAEFDLTGLDESASDDSQITLTQSDGNDDEVFDLSVFDETPTQNQTPAQSEFAVDDITLEEKEPVLDLSSELEDLSLDKPSTADVVTTPKTDDDFGLDFSLDSTSTAATKDTNDDFALSLDIDSPKTTDKTSSVLDDAGLDFDFESFDTITNKETSTQVQAEKSDDLDLDDGLDLQLNTPAPVSVDSLQDNNHDFDLDLGDFGNFAQDAKEAESKVADTAKADEMFSFEDDFNFDTAAATSDSKKDDANINFAFDENVNIESDTFSQVDNTPANLGDNEALVTKLDDFQVDFGTNLDDTIKTNDTDVIDIASDDALLDDVINNISFDEDESPVITDATQPSSEIIAPSVVAPVLSSMVNTTSSLDNVEQLDNAQITLDLAKNYLNLGEHDSAKRLLQEVMQAGNATQQQQAYTLLNRLG